MNIPINETKSRINPNVPATLSINFLNFSESLSALNSVKTGMKAVANAPSPNNRRKKLGILKATKKASVTAFAPKTWANTKSLIKPNIRDTKVIKPTVESERYKDSLIPLKNTKSA